LSVLAKIRYHGEKFSFVASEGTPMPPLTLEERVAALEKHVSELEARQANGASEKPWLRTMGAFAGNAEMKEIFDEALKLREADRKKTRRRLAKSTSRRAKK
jgi:hypothetical protein